MFIGLKIAWRLFQVFMFITVAYFVFTGFQVWQTSRRDEARPAQAILVFGAAQYDGKPSPVLEARLDQAIKLFRRDLSPYIVVTGGSQPGDRFTEAQASADYLLRHDVPDEAILREVKGTSSWESLAAAARFLRRRGITEVLLVSDPFHSARVAAMAQELGLEAHTSPTRTSPISGGTEVVRLAKETGYVAVGKLVGFRRLMRVNQAVEEVRPPR